MFRIGRTVMKTLALILLVLLLVLTGSLWQAARPFFIQVAPPAPVTVVIRPGEPFSNIARQLHEVGVVADRRSISLLAQWREATGRIQAGPYAFSAAATPGQVLDRLLKGDVIRTRITIPEGWTVREIAERLAATGVADRKAILTLAHDPAFARSLGVLAPGLEGYLFPETYLLVAGTPPEQILATLVGEFRRHLTPELEGAAKARGLSVHQLVTLASIVQMEAGTRAEMPLIAGVFANRLKRRMPLQADPTVIYGIPDFNGNLTRKNLQEWTPYNTYRIAGLPPGPIASPGDDALQAAAHPATVDYLYFVARGDGTHAFTANLVDHNRAVRRYQLHR